jgi:hypothetical protein
MMKRMVANAGAAAAMFLAACGGDVGTPGASPDARPDPTVLDGLESISIEPRGATLLIDGDEPAVAAFTAIGTFDDGRTLDITAHTTFSLADSALGSFSGPELTTGINRGGATRVNARAGGVQAGAGLTIVLRKRYADPGADLPADPEGAFDGAPDDAAKSPEIVYPAAGVLVPPNLERLEIHLVPSGGAQIFELTFESDTTDVVLYTSCTQPLNGGCIYQPAPQAWRWIAQSNRGGRVAMTARAIDPAGAGVGASASQEIVFSHDDIRGAIYYWTTSEVVDAANRTAIMRYDFASDQREAEIFIEPSQTSGNCVGCHALSPDGTKMFTAAGDTGGQVLLTDVATGEPLVPFDSTPRSAYGSWNPAGSQFVGTYSLSEDKAAWDGQRQAGWLSYNLNFFDGNTGQFIETVDLGGTAAQPISQPDWSHDGESIAFIRMGEMAYGNFDPDTGDCDTPCGSGTHAFAVQARVGYIEREGAGWSQPVYLSDPEPGENTFFPAFSPDDGLIAFNRSTCVGGENGTDCRAHGDTNATLFVIEPKPGAEPVELARANAPGPLDGDVVMNSFPKWTPFTFQRTGEFGTRLHWISFASDRMYGLREPGGEFAGTLIWMAGIDPDAAKSGQDPSAPAFALPFQELDTDNHTAQWTETAIIIE